MAKQRKLPANYLDVVYVPADGLAYRENEDGAVVLDMEHTGFFDRIAQRFFQRPRVSHITLDAYGSALWKLLDGERGVGAVAGAMETAFPDERERMLDRCVQFLGTLEANHFVTRR